MNTIGRNRIEKINWCCFQQLQLELETCGNRVGLSTPVGALDNDGEVLGTPVGTLDTDGEVLGMPVGTLDTDGEVLGVPVGTVDTDGELVGVAVVFGTSSTGSTSISQVGVSVSRGFSGRKYTVGAGEIDGGYSIREVGDGVPLHALRFQEHSGPVVTSATAKV
eukprot:CAMPEP_0195284772 /NCGR_PEP_ID=MMETSP0707-20130614/2858_1 /TAXON_ID=33640 /ORGANISM="Asterionellopsis glacialis, Strain CCMP134" /LENGTH=163 /DNA_ID=CAMNT_0040344165 /DNA_START=419 /DNA_END=910 /DNA_ORIENTATION=+